MAKSTKKTKRATSSKKPKKKEKITASQSKAAEYRMQSFGITQAARGPSEPIAQRSLMKDRGISERT